ncbi:MAG: hypothetical protein ACI4RD_08375 [Kiritimatiellia bacterium]
MKATIMLVLAPSLVLGVAMAETGGAAGNEPPRSCGCARPAPSEADTGVTAEQLDAAIAELQLLKTRIPPGGSLKPPTPKEIVAQLEAFRSEPEFAQLPEEQRRKFEEGVAQLRRELLHKPAAARPAHGWTSASPSPYVVRENGRSVYFIPKGRRR